MTSQTQLDVVLLFVDAPAKRQAQEDQPEPRWQTQAELTADEVRRELQRVLPSVIWSVRAVSSVAAAPPVGPSRHGRRAGAVLTQARSTLLALDVDIVVALSEAPLWLRGHQVRSHTSPAQQTAALALGTIQTHLPGRAASTSPDVTNPQSDAHEVVGLVLQLLGVDEDSDTDVGPLLRALAAPTHAADAEDTPDDRADLNGTEMANRRERRVRRTADTVRLVANQVVAARPWLLALRLSRTLLGASAAAFVAVVTPDFWLLADRMGAARLATVLVVLLVAAVVVLVVGGDLREWQPAPRRREVTTHNMVVWTSVTVGVLTMFAGIALANLAVTLLVLPRGLVAETVGHAATWETMSLICALTAGVSLLGSVFGAGLEEDDAVQDATYGNSDDVRFEDVNSTADAHRGR